jgi:hypothetical protein
MAANKNIFEPAKCNFVYIFQSDHSNISTHRKKKVREFPVPSLDVTTKLSLGGNNDVITELFLPRGSLRSDIPAGDGKLVNLFIRCKKFVFEFSTEGCKTTLNFLQRSCRKCRFNSIHLEKLSF